jgi:hypothetical protein
MMQGLMVAQLFHRIDGKTLNGVNSRTSSYRLARLSMPQSPAPMSIQGAFFDVDGRWPLGTDQFALLSLNLTSRSPAKKCR